MTLFKTPRAWCNIKTVFPGIGISIRMIKWASDDQDLWYHIPDNKVCGANMGPTWGWQDPGGPHVGPMNFGPMNFVSY